MLRSVGAFSATIFEQRQTAFLILSIVWLALFACSDDERDTRARFRNAIADQDMLGARSAALELGRELSDTPEAVVEVARMLADIGEMNQARWMLEEAVARHPGHVDLVLGLAETSLRVGDSAAALVVLEAVPEDAARASYAVILRARALVLVGQLDEALAVLAAASRRFDDPVTLRLEQIEVLSSEGRPVDALAIVREMQRDPAVPPDQHPWLRLEESDLVLRLEGPQAALALLDPIVEADPGAVEAATRRTSILIDLGRAEEALADLRATLEVRSDVAALNAIAARAALSMGDLEATEVFLRRYAEAEPGVVSLGGLASFLYEQDRSGEAAEILANVPMSEDPVHRIELRYQGIAMRIEAGDLSRARREIVAFQRDHPRNPRSNYLVARLDLAEGNPAAAAKRLALVLSQLDRTDVKHLLAVALERSGDLQGAEVRYGLVTMEGPSQFRSWAGLLRVLEAQQKWEQLAATALVASRIAPIRDLGLQALATAQLAMGKFPEAELVLRERLRLNPELPGPRVGLSVALRRQGRLDEALQVLDAASDQQERDPAVIAERVTVLGMSGRIPEAFEVLQASEVDGLSTPALRHAGIYLLFADGRGDEALVEAVRAAEVDPTDPVPHRMAADYLASTGQFEAALDPYRRTIERAPMAGDVIFRIGFALERAGREAEAIVAYRRVIELDEAAVGARNNLALILGRAGEIREALRVAQAAYARAEMDPLVMDTLASLYLDVGLSRRAAAMLEKAQGLDPDSDEIPYHLALAHRDQGRSVEARRLLTGLADRIGVEHSLHERIEDALASLP